jgi:hypothetical protein
MGGAGNIFRSLSGPVAGNTPILWFFVGVSLYIIRWKDQRSCDWRGMGVREHYIFRVPHSSFILVGCRQQCRPLLVMNFCTKLAVLFSSFRYWRYCQKRQLRCVKIGINRTIRINCLVGKVLFAFLNGDHPESSIKCFQYPENIFDAIPKGGVRKISQRKKCLWIFCYSIGLC